MEYKTAKKIFKALIKKVNIDYNGFSQVEILTIIAKAENNQEYNQGYKDGKKYMTKKYEESIEKGWSIK